MSTVSRAQTSSLQDLVAGLLSIALGLSALVAASRYPMGTVLRMGPGFFPSAIAALIILLGLVLIGAAFRSRPRRPNATLRIRPVLMIGLGVLVFALLLERAGLIPATLALVLLSSLAEPQWRPWRAAVLAVAMTALVYVIFILVLQIPVAAVSL